MTIYIGVDPGLHGAIAFLTVDGLEVLDMPIDEIIRNNKVRHEINGPALSSIIHNVRVHHGGHSVAAIENPGPRPHEPASRAYVFGKAVGLPMGVLYGQLAIVHPVAPVTWKKSYNLHRAGKDASRALASRYWPERALDFRLVKHHGRAEAALLAKYAQEHFSA